ncbi:MAG: hypothetical protein JST43_08755 [Bacteroidetes bacterium]|nr:hypothetical protein [Bacteroidota bacterium]MBS1541396.1 hypothetical protein [Bacteroidota bacterium]
MAANGQASSPFSRLGVGDLNNNGLAQNEAMGGVGISNPNGWYINNMNPALLVFNRVFAFQGGMSYEKRSAFDGTNNQSFKGGNLNYLLMAFPVIGGRWSSSIGALPYSSVNYNFTYTDYVTGGPSLIPVKVQETGKGGITQFYWSNGVAINKYLSVGVKASYLFSSINIKDFNTVNGLTNYGALQSRYSFGGTNLTGGISFHKDSIFHKNYRLNIGAIYSLKSNVGVTHKVTTETIANTGAIIDSTTLFNLSSKFYLPQTYGGGISLSKVDRWTVGADVAVSDYRKFVSFEEKFSDYNAFSQGLNTPTLGYRTALGGELTPRYEDFTNYFNRVTYRIGAFYEKLPFLVNSNPVFDRGGTFGISLPVGRISTIDIGVRIGKRGVASQNTLEENYFRLYFGATFNDQWFIKRKFD